MTRDTYIIRATYESMSAENGAHLKATRAPDAICTEAAGFPYAGTYVGYDRIFANRFQRLGTEWNGKRVTMDQDVDRATVMFALDHGSD